MKSSKLFILLFLFFSVLSLLGIIFKNEDLFLIAKTCVFPCILFYYFDKSIKINKLFILILLIFYVVDIILILQIDYLIFYLAILLNINHFIILIYSIKNIKKTKIIFKYLAMTFFMFMLGFTIQYLLFSSIIVEQKSAAYMIFISGIIVTFFSSISFYNYLIENNFRNFYFGFGCLAIGLMYAFYDIYVYIFYLDIIKVLSLIFKICSYYLFVRFILADERIQYKLFLENNSKYFF